MISILPLLFCAAGCGKSESGKAPAAAPGSQAVLAQYGFDIIPGAEAMGVKKSNEEGNLEVYLVPAAAGSYDALVERYKKILDQSKLNHGMPFPQKLTMDGKAMEFTGVGGMDYSHTVLIFISKPGQQENGTLLAVQVK
jgi:hypothetical protein